MCLTVAGAGVGVKEDSVARGLQQLSESGEPRAMESTVKTVVSMMQGLMADEGTEESSKRTMSEYLAELNALWESS